MTKYEVGKELVRAKTYVSTSSLLVRDERLTFVEYLQDEKRKDGEILNPVSEELKNIYVRPGSPANT